MYNASRINRSRTNFFIFPESPFDFERSAGIHGRVAKSLPDVYENGVYKRVLHLAENPVFVLVTSKGTIEKPRLSVEVHPQLLPQEVKALRRLLGTMFVATFDFDKFYSVAKKDRLMSIVARRLRGLRPVSPPSIFEALVIAITEQQISLNAAIAIRSRLIEKYGDTVEFEGRSFYAFPTPSVLAKAKVNRMMAVGLSRNKALYVNELSKKVAGKELDLEGLRKRDDEAAIAELTKIKGVGPWTAEYMLIRGMGRVNSLPADDVGIQHAISQAYFKGKRTTSNEVRRVLNKFFPFSGITAFYIMYYLFWMPERAK
ncbi:MAG: DNA-3-methyladenine glycosylase family protein [Candidatus Bathyarchaeia archaeon]